MSDTFAAELYSTIVEVDPREETRKLATIRFIDKILPHPNADRLEIAIVEGWQIVVGKGEFKAGTAAIYLEIDSVLPCRKEFDFLVKSCYVKRDWLATPGKEGYRLKTIKLRGEISQGLLMPISLLSDVALYDIASEEGQIDNADVTARLGVVKWDPPLPTNMSGEVKRYFPGFLRKTDQERLQNLWSKYSREYHESCFEITTKLDGSSCTIYKRGEEFGVCSRNLELKINDANSDNVFVQQALLYKEKLEKACSITGKNLALQGELVGSGLNGNRGQYKGVHFFIFDIWDIDNQCHLMADERRSLCHVTGFEHVPYQGLLWLFRKYDNIQDIISWVNTFKDEHGNQIEGLVFKNTANPEISFKLISPLYLIEHGE